MHYALNETEKRPALWFQGLLMMIVLGSEMLTETVGNSKRSILSAKARVL